MKLSNDFIFHNDGEEKILVSTGMTEFSGLVRGNSTAGFILSCLDQETTEDEIVEKMREKWDVSDETARNDVRRIVQQLKTIGAIEE